MNKPSKQYSAWWLIGIAVILVPVVYIAAREPAEVKPAVQATVPAATVIEPTSVPPPVQLPHWSLAENTSAEGLMQYSIVVSEPISHKSLDDLLRTLFADPSSVSGNPADTTLKNGAIWAYGDLEHVHEGGSWLAMISKPEADQFPTVLVADRNIEGLHAPKVLKSGLSETVRKRIFTQIVAAEDAAQKEADAKYPTNIDIVSIEVAKKNFLLNGNDVESRSEANRASLAKKLNISDEQLAAIGSEGSEKNWALEAPK